MKPAPADLVRFLRTSRPNGLSPSTGGLFSLGPLAAWPTPSPVSNHIIEKPIATSIIGQWQKGRLLGCGAYRSVYEATNKETGALCAMKEVDIVPDDPISVECIKQSEQEIRIFRHLNHRNIVQYYGK